MRWCWNLNDMNGGNFFRRYNVIHQDGRESIEDLWGDYGYGDQWTDESVMARFRSHGIYPRSFSRYEGPWEPYPDGYFTNSRRYVDGSMGSYNGYYVGDYYYNQGYSPRRQYGSNNGYYGSDYKRSMSPRDMGKYGSQGMMGTSMGGNEFRARDGSPRTSPRASPRSSPRRYRDEMY